MARVKVLRRTLVRGEPREPGERVTVAIAEALRLTRLGAAELIPEDG